MKTAIIYISKHGATAKIARYIAEKINLSEACLIDLRKNKNPDISGYDRVIIGGSIHAGMIQKRVKEFCKNNLDLLIEKETGLFLSAMDKTRFEEEFNNAFPHELRKNCKAYVIPGGEFTLEKMNFLEKKIVKKVGNIDKSISDIDYKKIDEFAGHFADPVI